MQRLFLLIPLYALPFCAGNDHKTENTPPLPVVTVARDSLPGYDFAKVSTADCLEKNWLGQTVISSASR
jgi:hypothetical protein